MEDPPDEILLDDSILTRRMGRKALLLEAATKQYQIAHFPHNPFCDACKRTRMKQRRYAKHTEAEDDGLTNVSEPLKRLGTDTMIIAKAATDDNISSASHNRCIHTIRDEYSGMSYAVPQQTRSADEHFNNLKFFAGVVKHRPEVLVKSDAAKELTGPIRQLGWHPEWCLEKRWPHNDGMEHSSQQSGVA